MVDASRKELNALKEGLARILQEENPLPPHEQYAREAELSRRLSSNISGGSPSPAQALDSQDLSIMSRLLSQVHHLLEGENKGEELMPKEDVEGPDFLEHQVQTEKSMVAAVVEIASAAAEAAKAAAASSGKNLEVMETVISNSEKIVLPNQTCHDENGRTAKALEDESSKQPNTDKDIIKKLERQHRITHWVLGIMIVTTAVWRFKLLSMFLGVRNTFTNPFQALGGMVSESFNGGDKEDPNGVGKGFHKAKTVLPSVLGSEEEEITKKPEKTDHSTSEDFKIGEAITFSMDNLLSANGTSDKHASEGASEEGSSKD